MAAGICVRKAIEALLPPRAQRGLESTRLERLATCINTYFTVDVSNLAVSDDEVSAAALRSCKVIFISEETGDAEQAWNIRRLITKLLGIPCALKVETYEDLERYSSSKEQSGEFTKWVRENVTSDISLWNEAQHTPEEATGNSSRKDCPKKVVYLADSELIFEPSFDGVEALQEAKIPFLFLYPLR